MLVALFVWALIRSVTLTYAGGTNIPITLYTDNACETPSTTAANISLNLGVCVVTPGLGSFELEPFPCPSGSVANYVFSDTACGQVDENSYYRGGNNGYCYAPYTGDMAALMLSCDQTDPGQPTSTTTIDVGPVATGGASTSAASSPSPTVDGGDGDGSSNNGTNTTSGSDSSSDSSSLGSGWDSLNYAARIGIIVSLAMGIPTILIGLFALWQKRQSDRRKAQKAALIHGTPMPTSRYFHGGANGAFQSGAVPSRPAPMRQPLSHAQKWGGYRYINGGGGEW